MDEAMDEGTPVPGARLPVEVADSLISKLKVALEGSLNPEMWSCVPLACRLLGDQMPGLFWDNRLRMSKRVFVYLDFPDELRETTFGDVKKYILEKEPWEDYDICVFDDSFDWFVGFTHNDTINVLGLDNLLNN